jgi:hypothetical protein
MYPVKGNRLLLNGVTMKLKNEEIRGRQPNKE